MRMADPQRFWGNSSMRAAMLLASAAMLAIPPLGAAQAQYGGVRVSPRHIDPVPPVIPEQLTTMPASPAGMASPPPVLPPAPQAQMPVPMAVAQPAPPPPRPGPAPVALQPQLPFPVPAAGNAPAIPPGTPTESTIVNLIRLLVDEGVLTQDRAGALIRQAQDEAVIAARAAKAETASIAGIASAAPPAAAAPPGEPPQPASPRSIRVPYVPQFVRNQIKDEVKQELVQQAILEHWAQPDAVPEWTRRFHFNGDFRLRYEMDMFDGRNSPFFPNFLTLDTGNPFDLNNSAGTPPPLINTTVDRERLRIRARLGTDIEIADNFSASIRMATGNTINPVTTNQTLGNTLNKENFLLDRAFLEYRPIDEVSLRFGRFPLPWFSTDLVWYNEINFDGLAAAGAVPLSNTVSVFSTLGAFPIEFSPFNFPDNSSAKQNSRDKWLYGAQAGADWKPTKDSDFKAAVAFYDFDSIEGKLSSPCVALSAADQCDTDDSRPQFTQGGNTLFAIRNLVPTTTNPPVFQYYGLASPFRELNVTARYDVTAFDRIHVILDADFVDNLAFDASKIAAKNPVNNRGPSPDGVTPGPYQGGGLGFHGRLTFGHPELVNRWDWNFTAGYRYIESDAVVDAFNDSDFRLGGTNAKGYVIGGGLGIAHNVNLFARWLSATEVSGSPYSFDIVMMDLNAKF
jgi:putative porin